MGGITMKKIFTIVITFLLVVTIISCGSKANYTEEFSYLPKYENMELEKVIEPSSDNEYSTATYIINDAKKEGVNDVDPLTKEAWEEEKEKKKQGEEAAKPTSTIDGNGDGAETSDSSGSIPERSPSADLPAEELDENNGNNGGNGGSELLPSPDKPDDDNNSGTSPSSPSREVPQENGSTNGGEEKTLPFWEI